MKAYGISNKKSYNYRDNHPDKHSINWWENMESYSKKRARQLAKRQVKEELIEHENDWYEYEDDYDFENEFDYLDEDEIDMFDEVWLDNFFMN